MSEYKALDPYDGKFEHIPFEGWKYVGDSIPVYIKAVSLSKPNARMSDSDLFEYSSILQNLYDDVYGFQRGTFYPSKPFQLSDFLNYHNSRVYKYVSNHTYDEYVSKGSFLLSSLKRFRDFEAQGRPEGDRFEGLTSCLFSIGNRELTASALSGFDTLAFSASTKPGDHYQMSSAFGDVLLEIYIKGFASTLAKLLGSKPEIRQVRYRDLKMVRSSLSSKRITFEPELITPSLVHAIRSQARLPSIFAKPSRFSHEREVRLAFRFSHEVQYDKVIESRSLLRWVRRLN